MPRNTDETLSIDIIAGERMKEVRLAKGLSRAQLALKIGVTHQQLAKYEKGLNRLTIGRLVMVATHLKKPLNYFIKESFDIMPTDHERLCMLVSRDFAKITNRVNRLAVANLVRTLSKDEY